MTNDEDLVPSEVAPRRCRRSRMAAGIVASWFVLFATASPSLADHSTSVHGTYTMPPTLFFVGNTADTDNSTQHLYVTVGNGNRMRISARAGSGTGSTNDCYLNNGWLPNGSYGRGDGDSLSRADLIYKTWGDPVVRGYVWFFDRKRCDGAGTTIRSELFLHSSGIEGTPWNNNWKSNGCIKVSQHARGSGGTGYVGWWSIAYDRHNELLSVSHPG